MTSDPRGMRWAIGAIVTIGGLMIVQSWAIGALIVWAIRG